MNDTAHVYLKAARWSMIAITLLALVSVSVGAIIGGVDGALSALAGAAVAVIFSVTTQVAAWRGARSGPMAFVSWVAITWLIKIVIVIVAAVAAQYQTWLVRPLFGLVLLAGVLIALGIDIVAVWKARIPYVSANPTNTNDGVG
jgi:hypothetical protein